jgi:hypothetical protein
MTLAQAPRSPGRLLSHDVNDLLSGFHRIAVPCGFCHHRVRRRFFDQHAARGDCKWPSAKLTILDTRVPRRRGRGHAWAQEPAPDRNTEVSKETENPVTRQITLPLRYEAEFEDIAYKAMKPTFEIDQAVVPFRLNQDWALITRTKLPVVVQPPKKGGDHWATGLSNGYTTFFLSPGPARRLESVPRRRFKGYVVVPSDTSILF